MNNDNHIQANSPLEAWASIFLRVMERSGNTLPATTVSIQRPSHETVSQKHALIDQLDALLRSEGKPVVRESSGIIFPYTQWRCKGWHIDDLSRWYMNEFMPRLKGVSAKHGKTYFSRLVKYTGVKQTASGYEVVAVNQLETVIQFCKDAAKRGTHFRESGLQMALVDPAKDLTASARSNFPCLHQIGLSFDSEGGLELSAFYPTQFVVERALGNYLGLCQLGIFIASELEIPFVDFTCFIATPQRGGFNKGQLSGLKQTALSLMRENTTFLIPHQP